MLFIKKGSRMRIRMWHWCDEVIYWCPFSMLQTPCCRTTSLCHGPFSRTTHIHTCYHYCTSFLVVPSGCLLKRGSSKANLFLIIFFRSWLWGRILLSVLGSPRDCHWTLDAVRSLLSNTQQAQNNVLNSTSPARASHQGIYGGRSAAPRRR